MQQRVEQAILGKYARFSPENERSQARTDGLSQSVAACRGFIILSFITPAVLKINVALGRRGLINHDAAIALHGGPARGSTPLTNGFGPFVDGVVWGRRWRVGEQLVSRVSHRR